MGVLTMTATLYTGDFEQFVIRKSELTQEIAGSGFSCSLYLISSFQQWRWGRLSGQAPPLCQHQPVSTKTNHQPMQIRASTAADQ